MTERFQKLYSLEPNIYDIKCPLLIEAGVLHKDTETGNVFVQLKMKNIGEGTIIACKVTIKAYESNGAEIQGVDRFQYLDVDVCPGQEFGSKTPIILPNSTARSFFVIIEEIVYKDGRIIQERFSEWKVLKKQETIFDYFKDTELSEQYRIDAGGNAEFVPYIDDGIFYCACGEANLDTVQKCCRCGRTYDLLSKLLNQDELINHKDVRLKKEQEQKTKEAAKAREKEKRLKRNIKLSLLAIAAVLVLAVGGFIAYTMVKYNMAEKAYEAGSYVQAKETWSEIEYYSKAKAKKGYACAQYAIQLLEEQNYRYAEEIIRELEGYDIKDAGFSEMLNSVYDSAYSKAISLCNNRDYQTSLDLFSVSKGEKRDWYIKYCEVAIEVSGDLEKKSLTELYQKIIELNDFNNAQDLIRSNQYLSKISEWEGMWKATKAKGWGKNAEAGALFIEIKNGSLITITKKNSLDKYSSDHEYEHELFLIDGKIKSGHSYMVEEKDYDSLDEVIVTGNTLRLNSNDTDGYIECTR